MQEILQRRASRRDVLKFIGVGYGALAIGQIACSKFLSDIPNDSPSFADYENQARLIENPIYRAASVILTTENGGIGHGGIYLEDGELFLRTISHVTRSFEPNTLQVIVPSIDSYRFDINNSPEYMFLQSGLNYDFNVRYQLPGEMQEKLEEAIGKDEIRPLELFQSQSFRSGARFAVPMPHTGELSRMMLYDFDIEHNYFIFKQKSGYVCRGFSGMPVLALDENDNLTNKSIGSLMAQSVERVINPSDDCSDDLYFVKPHLQWVLFDA